MTVSDKKARKAAYMKAYREANREKLAAREKAYYETNREKYLAQMIARHKANREKRLAQMKARYKDNREKAAAQMKVWRLANQKKAAAQKKAWQLSNSDKVNASTAKRRSQKLQATPRWMTKEDFAAIQEWYEIAKDLQWLSEEPLHVDHIIPLQGKEVCGLHIAANLQILPASMNIRKGNKI